MHGPAMPRRRSSDFDDGTLAVSIVMPCLNETESLAHCIANARVALASIKQRYDLDGEIVIADNGSTDGSQALAASLGARVVDVTAKGYGAALIGGFRQARGRFLVMGDADGSYDFLDAVPMIGKLVDGAELCMGSRFKGGIKPGAMPWKNRYIGNPALTGVLNLFFRTGISDAHCGIRAITREAFNRLKLTGSGMEFASEMVIKASLANLRVAEVPATLSPDLRQRAPHLRPWRDGWRHLRYLFMLSPSWAFGVPAMTMILAALTILSISVLHFVGVIPQEVFFGDSWTIVAGFLLTTGHIGLIMQAATHFYGVKQGYRTLNPWFGKLARVLTLEHALVIGGAFIVTSAGCLAAIGVWWRDLGFAALPTTVPLVCAVTIGAIGLQTALGGFLLAVISGNEAQFTGPDDPQSSSS